MALLFLRTAMFFDLRIGVLKADQNIRETLVVAQKHVVARLELLNEVLLQKQRLGLGLGREKHHRRGFRDHARNTPRMPGPPRVIRHPRPQVSRLADIENPGLRIEHSIHARRAIQCLQIALNTLMTCQRGSC